MKKNWLSFVFILLAGFAFAQDTASPKTKFGDVAIANLKTLDGKTISSLEFRNDGKPMIIDFWATWCKPCINELNTIQDRYADWQEETGVKIIAISIDDSRTSSSVAPFVSGKGWEYEVYLDINGDFKRAMNVNNVPHVFLLDGNGKIVLQHNSYTPGDEDELYEKIKLLTEKK